MKLFVLIFSLLTSSAVFASQTVKICLDKNMWYPFTFVEKGQATGLHIDIVSKAINDLGFTVEYKPLPWKRCVAGANDGDYDAIAVASYKDKRAKTLNFPSDAASAAKSTWRVMQVEYTVVSTTAQSYEYDGDINTLPTPVRVPRGWSIGDDLKKQGVKVDDGASGDEKNLKKLLRMDKGSVVALPQVAELYSKKSNFKGKLHASKKPIKSKSYYLPFSKKSKISDEDQQRIWAQIAKVRDDVAFIESVSVNY
jgi:polar amino acid transport system substrate-binding protein